MFELFMYVYSCNALSAWSFDVDRALNSYFMIMIMIMLADLRCCRDVTAESGMQKSVKYYWGAWPFRQLCTMTLSLYLTRSGTDTDVNSRSSSARFSNNR